MIIDKSLVHHEPNRGNMMYFLDFSGPINIIIEIDDIQIKGNEWSLESDSNVYLTVETKGHDKFTRFRDQWKEELVEDPDSKYHKNIEPDKLLWKALSEQPEYMKNYSVMRSIMTLVF
jgi:hypothetical protein